MKKIFLIFFFSFLFSFSGKAQTLPSSRAVDWTLAGLRDTTTNGFIIINMQNYGVVGDSITPNDSVLSSVLTFYLDSNIILIFPSGIFLFNNTINLPSNTIIKGQGPYNTVFKFDLGGNGNSIDIQGSSISTDTSSFTQSAIKDSSSFFVLNPLLFSGGDWIRIIQTDSALVTSSWALNTVGQVVQIEKIINNKIVLASPLRMNYDILLSPHIQKIKPVQNVGIECLKIYRTDNTSPQQSCNIHFYKAVNCWVNSIESQNCTYSHIKAEYSSNLSVSKSYFHHAFDYGSGGRGYGVMLHYTSNECLVENNIFMHLRHSMILQSGANGNVFSYNYSFDPYWTSTPNNSAGDMVLHGNYPYSNLFEQNICRNIVIDDSHGTSGPYNTFFRNRAEGYGIFFSANNTPNQNFLGNDISNTNFPYNLVNYTILGIGHFIYGNNNKGTIDPSGTNVLPDSSYFYISKPFFVPTTQWVAIGTPNIMGTASIPARDRYLSGVLFDNSCGNIITENKANKTTYDILLYPNPTTEILNIRCKNDIKSIRLFDIQGNLVFFTSPFEKYLQINIKDVKKGIYFLFLSFPNNKVIVKKIIKI